MLKSYSHRYGKRIIRINQVWRKSSIRCGKQPPSSVLMSDRAILIFKGVICANLSAPGMVFSNLENNEFCMNEDGFIFVVNGSVGLMQHWLKNGFHKSAREMAETIYDMAFPIPG